MSKLSFTAMQKAGIAARQSHPCSQTHWLTTPSPTLLSSLGRTLLYGEGGSRRELGLCSGQCVALPGGTCAVTARSTGTQTKASFGRKYDIVMA